MKYPIEEHRHRFAAWAAGRAASTSSLCRFGVEEGKRILEDAGLGNVGRSVDSLPQPDDFDAEHRQWRKNVIKAARRNEVRFTHGVAAKLINVYFKSTFVCGGLHEDPRVQATHPPIDSLLLDRLYRYDVEGLREEWKLARDAKWSKMNSRQYEKLIAAIQRALPHPHGLWEIEEHWAGFTA